MESSLTVLLEEAQKGNLECMVRLVHCNQFHRVWYDGLHLISEEEEFCWLSKAAEQKYPQLYIPLGLYYQCGIGVEQNRDSALFWYNKAKEAGVQTPLNHLIELWINNWTKEHKQL